MKKNILPLIISGLLFNLTINSVIVEVTFYFWGPSNRQTFYNAFLQPAKIPNTITEITFTEETVLLVNTPIQLPCIHCKANNLTKEQLLKILKDFNSKDREVTELIVGMSR